MWKALKYLVYFGFLACLGILLGCYIHGKRVNQPTLMSGVAFVREFPYGEHIVGYTETYYFGYKEQKHYEEYMEEHGDSIKIDPKVLERHRRLEKTSQ
jgi:hypothetical protein